MNWDEFRFLTLIYQLRAGTLTHAFQTGYTHAFLWLTHVPGSEVDQIITARLFYFVLLLISACCLTRIAARFVSQAGSCVVAVSFLCFSNVIVHGTAFRADGLALCLSLLAITLVLSEGRSTRRLTAAAIFFGTSFFITVKVVFVTLAVVPLLLLDVGQPLRARIRQTLGFSAVSASWAGLLFTMHALAIGTAGETAHRLQLAGRKTLLGTGLFPQAPSLIQTLWFNYTIWSLLVAGLGIVLLRVTRPVDRSRALRQISLILPLLSILIYRNSYPYFFVLVVPTALVFVGVAYDRLAYAVRRRPLIALVVPLLMMGDAWSIFGLWTKDTIRRQRLVVETVHQLFPDPVPYIDGASVISSFPQVGFFMSSWGLEAYQEQGTPVFEGFLLSEQPAFLLVDQPSLDVFPHWGIGFESTYPPLLSADVQVLREQFVHLWGPIFVPGLESRVSAAQPYRWKTLISGTFTSYSDGDLIVDGNLLRPGEKVYLSTGWHVVTGLDSANVQAILRVIPQEGVPTTAPPKLPLFVGL